MAAQSEDVAVLKVKVDMHEKELETITSDLKATIEALNKVRWTMIITVVIVMVTNDFSGLTKVLAVLL
jgi:CHASE3 domain sensor protein